MQGMVLGALTEMDEGPTFQRCLLSIVNTTCLQEKSNGCSSLLADLRRSFLLLHLLNVPRGVDHGDGWREICPRNLGTITRAS